MQPRNIEYQWEFFPSIFEKNWKNYHEKIDMEITFSDVSFNFIDIEIFSFAIFI